MERIFPALKYRAFRGLRLLTELGLPASWSLADSPVLRTWYDFSRMAHEEPLRSLRTTEQAVVIGAEWAEFKTMSITDSQNEIVCSVESGEIWRLSNYPGPATHESFVNSSAAIFERFLRSRDEFRKAPDPSALYPELKRSFLSAEPSLAWRGKTAALWREFLDECDVEFGPSRQGA